LWRTRNYIKPIDGAAITRRRSCKIEIAEFTQTYNRKGVLLKSHYSRCLLRGGAPRQHIERAAALTSQLPVLVPPSAKKSGVPARAQEQETGHSVLAPIVNSRPLDNMLRVVTVVQQIMTEFIGAVSEEYKIVASTKFVLNLMKHNAH
jgi:hypothetical protein